MRGKKFDGQGPEGGELKARWELMLYQELREAVQVLTAGAIKYGDWDWMYVRPISRYMGAIQRHWNLWLDGEKHDKDLHERSGIKVSHLACVVCNTLFLMWFDKHIPGWMEKESGDYFRQHTYDLKEEE